MQLQNLLNQSQQKLYIAVKWEARRNSTTDWMMAHLRHATATSTVMNLQ